MPKPCGDVEISSSLSFACATHVHLVTKLRMCKSVAALLYTQYLDNVHGTNERLTFILYRMSERVHFNVVSWYLGYTINNLRASYGSQRFTNEVKSFYSFGHYFSKFHSNINLPLVHTRAKQSDVSNKDIETTVGHN